MVYRAQARSVKKKKKKVLRKRVVLLLIVFLGLVATYIGARVPYTETQGVIIKNNNLVLSMDILEHVETIMSNDDSIFFPQKQFVFFDSAMAEESITRAFPEISNTSIQKNANLTVTVDVTERIPTYTYCSDESCYEMDLGGTIFRTKENPTGSALIFSSRTKLGIDDRYLSEDKLDQLTQLVGALETENLAIYQIYDYSVRTYMLVTGQGTRIFIPKEDTYDDIYSLMKKMIESGGFGTLKETQDFKDTYAYINVQFGKKIFSCMKGEVCESNYSL